LVGVDEADARARCGEHADQERAHSIDGARAVALTQCIVQEAVQDVSLLDPRTEPIEERVLRGCLHDPVGARDQQLCRHGDGLRVGDDTVRGFLQPEQDVDGNRPRQQRIGFVACDARRIVRQEFGLDVARHEKIARESAHQTQSREREWNVELHAKRRRGEHHPANARRVIVDPRRDEYSAHALRDDADVLGRDAVFRADVVDERLHVAHRRTETRRIAACAGRAPVAARVPCKESEVRQHEFVYEVRHSRRMLVAAVEEHDRAARGAVNRRPVPIEEVDAVVRAKRPLVDRAQLRTRRHVVHVSGPRAARRARD